MKSPDPRPVLAVIALLLLANLLSTWLAPQQSPTLLPLAEAHGESLRPLRRADFGQATFVTSSQEGGTLYVWDTEIVKGRVRAKGKIFVATQ